MSATDITVRPIDVLLRLLPWADYPYLFDQSMISLEQPNVLPHRPQPAWVFDALSNVRA